MNKIKPGREVMVVGVGLHPFGRFPDEDLGDLGDATAHESTADYSNLADVQFDLRFSFFGALLGVA